MDDPIEIALRRKKNSSMRVAIDQVKDGANGAAAAHAAVSGGNTGALMAIVTLRAQDPGRHRQAGHCLCQLPNEMRPAGPPPCWTWAPMSTALKNTLLQFAVMGSRPGGRN